ncbi:hypothetical protein Aperf_G00000070844 [Anoplocephala perfoliata]
MKTASVAAEGNKKGEKEPHLSQTAQEEGEQQQQYQEQAEGQLQQLPPSSTSSPSSHHPLSPPRPSAEEAAEFTSSSAEPKPSTSAAKSPSHGEGGVRTESTAVAPESSISEREKTEVTSSSVKTASAPATPSGVSWLAEKAIVLVRFAECFRRGHVIRYDAELNMCVVQLEFSNTVVNKGIEDIFPDDPAIIAAATEALKKKEEEERLLLAGSSRPPGSGVPCPSSAPPFMVTPLEDEQYISVVAAAVVGSNNAARELDRSISFLGHDDWSLDIFSEAQIHKNSLLRFYVSQSPTPRPLRRSGCCKESGYPSSVLAATVTLMAVAVAYTAAAAVAATTNPILALCHPIGRA